MNFNSDIQQLSHFSKQEGVEEIITGLRRLSDARSVFEMVLYAPIDISDTEQQTLIDDLRIKLHVVLEKAEKDFTVYRHASLATASHHALLALAKLRPKNDEDRVTLEVIPSRKQVVTSDGYQHNIDALIEFQKKRPARKETKEKISNFKSLIDPSSNLPFSPRDSAYIQKVALEKGLTIPWLVTQHADNPNMIKIAEELKYWMAQKSPNEIAHFLIQIDNESNIYGENLASSLQKATPMLEQAKKLLKLQAKLEKTAPKLQKAKNLIDLKDEWFWRARFILSGCTVSMFGYALECFTAETGTALDLLSAWSIEAGLVVGSGLALYGLMATPKITEPSLSASDREAIDLLSTLSVS